jgi:hypothetical protein
MIPQTSFAFKHRVFLNKLLQAAREVEEGRLQPTYLASLIKSARPSELKALCEVSENLLKKRYQPKKRFLRVLLPFKKLIRRLACRKTSVSSKKQALLRNNTQVGGLPFLVPLLAPIIGTLISAGIEAAI